MSIPPIAPARKALPVRMLTRLLADMQTTINAGALRTFDGELDRFIIYSLIVRESVTSAGRPSPISTYSLALSLGRPFETVRRHVQALFASGRCVRVKGGVVAADDIWTRPDMLDLLTLTHDSFVRFAADAAPYIADLPPVADRPYHVSVGVQAAADIMLATLDSNRAVHHGWLDLVLFSTVLHANMCRYESDAKAVPAADGTPAALAAHHAVRASAIARALNLPETTARRRLTTLSAPGGPLVRTRAGLIVSVAWMDQPAMLETSQRSYSNLRRIIARAAAQGFPIDRPETAYLHGRPPTWIAG